jgi:tryptophan 2,3-dioxygenase
MEHFVARDLQPSDLIPVNYWDYVGVDMLLSLQKPRTHFPDEKIFIGYHQVTELLLMLALHELDQLTVSLSHSPSPTMLVEKLGRIHRYLGMCAQSFDVMSNGMDPAQYNTFRHALAPASGFQSFQFRKMEIMATDLLHLVRKEVRAALHADAPVESLLTELYWRAAGLDRATGERTPTMTQFEDKYWGELTHLGLHYRKRNLWQQYLRLSSQGLDVNILDQVRSAMRRFDWLFNQEWPLVHYNAACRYLDVEGSEALGTGGSKWKEYLHPKYQRRIFYPELWSAEELAQWGEVKLD